MLRNREIKHLFASLLVLGILSTLISIFLFSARTALYVALVSLLFMVIIFYFTKWRYNELDKLSSYLRQIAGGDYHLDVRDNVEGELSILKNEIYKVTKMLAEQGEQLNKDKEKLTDAISDISHQIKTPLTSMTIMVDLLRDKNLEEEKRIMFTRNLQVQLERMEWLVSSLLKLSKIDAGTVTFKKEKVRVQELVDHAIKPLLIPMDIKMQRVNVEGDEKVSFLGDFNWTAEAIINVLKNCVEHTRKGGEISISYAENALFTEITIEDNGIGIPKEDLPYIFKRFYKGKTASDDSVGIGLAMAHTIITSQQGDITVHSEQNKGTTFTIKFYKQVI